MKLLKESEVLQPRIQVFGEDNALQEQLCEAGEQFVLAMYQGGISSVNSLDKLRAMYFKTPKYVPVDKMPPTSRSWFFHLQVNTWKNLEMKLPVERSGYQVVQGTIEPIITDMPVAPDELLRDIRYSCQKKNRLCSTCCCSKRRLACSIHCKCKGDC